MGPKTGPKKELEIEQFWAQFGLLFRDLFANLSFLPKTHGAYTRALILRAEALEIHNFWAPFSAPFLVPFSSLEMGPKWDPKWEPKNQKIAFGGFWVPPWAPKVRKKGVLKMVPKWTLKKSEF